MRVSTNEQSLEVLVLHLQRKFSHFIFMILGLVVMIGLSYLVQPMCIS